MNHADIVAVFSGGASEAFSADTGMEEMLLVCRRKSDKQVLIEREILKDWTKKSPKSESSKKVPSIYCVTLRSLHKDWVNRVNYFYLTRVSGEPTTNMYRTVNVT